MAIIANTFLTFAAIGNREDLKDIIYNISPTDTPFMAAIGRGKAKAVLTEWQTDELDPPGSNAQLEGNDATFAAVTPTERLSNRCQISDKTVIVSGTQEAVDKAGRKSEMVYQMLKKSKSLKRDMETILTGNQAPVTGSSTVARQLRPLCGWYATNTNRGATGANGTAVAAATDGTQRAFTEDMAKEIIQKTWNAGGDVNLILVGPHNKTVFSGFLFDMERNDRSEDKKVTSTVSIWESDFGTHRVKADRFSRERDAHFLDTSMWKLLHLRPMRTKDLAPTGDAEKGLILVEYTLQSSNEAASGIVADLTTA